MESQRNSQLLIFNNYIYNIDKIDKEWTRWRCQQRGCLASVVISSDRVAKSVGVHSHSEETSKIMKLNFLKQLKAKAIESKIRARDIVIDCTSKLDDETIKFMPHLKSLVNCVTRQRNKIIGNFKLRIQTYQSF
jgi:hypothetical protein